MSLAAAGGDPSFAALAPLVMLASCQLVSGLGDLESEPGPSTVAAGGGDGSDTGGAGSGGDSCDDPTDGCVKCSDATDCPEDEPCRVWMCDASNRCEAIEIVEGTLVDRGAVNDCVSLQCDGAGSASVQPDDGEVPPVDDNECIYPGVCRDGAPEYLPLPAGEPCTVGGVVCDAGDCGPAILVDERFDGLPAAAGSSSFDAFQTALPGWAVVNDNFSAQVGNGATGTGGIYSFGDAGSDRALGGVASGGTSTQAWGVCGTNWTDVTLQSVTVAFVGEQWRGGGTAEQQSLAFAFSTAVTPGTLATDIRAANTANHLTGWEGVGALTFTSPIATAITGPLAGNDAANRTELSAQLPGLALAPGATLCVRWVDLDDPGNDHGLGIDELLIVGL